MVHRQSQAYSPDLRAPVPAAQSSNGVMPAGGGLANTANM
jgi:hypothetical protein